MIRKQFIAAIAAALALAAPATATATTSPQRLRQQLNQVVAALGSLNVPGGVIGVTGGPATLSLVAFGPAPSGAVSAPGLLGNGCPKLAG